jgi:hypothetical protein
MAQTHVNGGKCGDKKENLSALYSFLLEYGLICVDTIRIVSKTRYGIICYNQNYFPYFQFLFFMPLATVMCGAASKQLSYFISGP